MTGIVVSQSLVISAGVDDLNADSPIVGYQTLVTAGNIDATTEASDFPASNLANPVTHLIWKAAAVGDNYVTVVLDTPEEVDYLAIAAHNFGSGLMVLSVEGNADSPSIGSPNDEWFELVPEAMATVDGPLIFRFTKQSLYAVRLRIQTSQSSPALVPQIGVMYVGALLYMQRRLYVGHTPLTYGRQLSTANLRSINGAFLGRIVLGQTRKSSASFQNLTPDWFRTYLDPFLIAAQESPFFFAWRPGSYPSEAGFAWFVDDPDVGNQRGNGMMQVTMNMEGVA